MQFARGRGRPFVALALGLGVLALTALQPTPAAARILEDPPRAAAERAAGTESYISILWARANWQATGSNCTVIPSGSRTLQQNAQDLRDRGLSATAQVVVNRTLENVRPCFAGYTLQSSWQDLVRLRDDYGWSVTSQGMNYANMTLMTTDEQRYAESAASLPPLAAHGFPRAWGSFAFANNKLDAPAKALVNRYFGFGRVYGSGINDLEQVATEPHLMSTWSVNGGKCHNRDLPCYGMSVKGDRRSVNVNQLKQALNPAPGKWTVVQFYRLVEGSLGAIGDGLAWDCTSPDWRNRWTSQAELSCRNTFLEAIDARSVTAKVTDPTTVAEAIGRIPDDFLGWPHP